MQDIQDQKNKFYSVESEIPTSERISIDIENFLIKGNRSLLMGLNLVAQDIRGKRILDIGCGAGIDTVVLLKMAGYDATGIDLSINRIGIGQGVASRFNINPDCLRIQTIQDITEKYDIIIGNGIVHHFVDYRSLLLRVRDLLNPGGKCLFLEPTIFPFRFLQARCYKQGEFYIKSSCIEIYINPFKLIKALRDAGFSNIQSFANGYHHKLTQVLMKFPFTKYLWHANFFYAEK